MKTDFSQDAANTLARRAPPMSLLVALIAFPQLSETIYTPVLPGIAQAFGIDAAQAQLTMSVYFAGFAIGVLLWGRMADRYGRRPAMLAALLCYCAGAVGAMGARDFAVLLAARVLLAIGASAGSVVVQTMLRDLFQGARLAAVFSGIVAALSLSPALGPILGTLLAHWYGYRGVFSGLCALGAALALGCVALLCETRPIGAKPAPSIISVGRRVLTDRHVLRCILLVGGFNVIVFGYYTLAPFTLEHLGMPDWVFAVSGVLIGASSLWAARLNRRALTRWDSAWVIRAAVCASVVIALLQLLGLTLARHHPLWAVGLLLGTQCGLMVSFGSAIPNVLSGALIRYRDELGTAGALYGFAYYLLIGAGLWVISTIYRPDLWFQPAAMLALGILMWLIRPPVPTSR